MKFRPEVIMPLTCRECSHNNPREAVFCYFDGVPLEGSSGGDAASISISVQGFVRATDSSWKTRGRPEEPC